MHAQPQLQHRHRHLSAFSGLHSASQVSQSAMKCVNRLEQVHLAFPIKENAREGFCKLATCELFDELCFHNILWENTWQCRKPLATGRRDVRVCSHLALSSDLVWLSSFLSSMELCQGPKGTEQSYWPWLKVPQTFPSARFGAWPGAGPSPPTCLAVWALGGSLHLHPGIPCVAEAFKKNSRLAMEHVQQVSKLLKTSFERVQVLKEQNNTASW